MRKFKIVCIVIFLIYLGIIILGNQMLYQRKKVIEENRDNSIYLVEVNRLYKTCMENPSAIREIQEMDENALLKQGYSFIRRVAYLAADEEKVDEKGDDSNGTDAVLEFFSHKNGYFSIIRPLVVQQRIQGYLRFDCVPDDTKNEGYIMFNLGLLLIGIIVFGILWYIYRKIICPFHRFSEIPYELSRGNLQYDVKEEKSRYFGKFVWGIGMLKDRLEYQKQRELKLAREKKMILLSISHDIKTPLHTIELYAKALERGMYQDREEQRTAAIKIQEKSAEIDKFVKEIVKSSTEDIFSIEVKNQEYYLKELVIKIQNAYMEKCKLRHTNLIVDEYDNYLLYGDLDRTYEVVGNLMENAFKYGDGVEIHIRFAEEENHLLFTIYNSGQPVAESEIVHLFDSFFRGSNAEGKPGNGLDLYICREIMLKMNGDIYATRCENGMSVTMVIKIS